MLTFSKYIAERFVNLIGNDPRKDEHAAAVKNILDKSYADVKGIHGSGFRDHEDMKRNIPMWKLHKRGNDVKAAVMYKDKNGRKMVAVGSDGSSEGKKAAGKMVTDDLKQGRAYGEQSGPLLASIKKHVGAQHLQQHVIPFHEVHKHLDHDDEIRKPPEDDAEVQAHPEFKDHLYQRKIGDQWHTKLMLGKPGNKIVKK